MSFRSVANLSGLSACIVLILFLGSARSALVAAVAIPMSLVAVFILMNLTRMPANLFSLGAIDFGAIVDGTIVVMEPMLSVAADGRLRGHTVQSPAVDQSCALRRCRSHQSTSSVSTTRPTSTHRLLWLRCIHFISHAWLSAPK